ncbi:ABC transporter ATP-binding protein [Uliginosibacterium sp. H1]|uniref:ABC transporter ATP-binding protein n=1 Tax=Uliginosibacterium sp. H1 TaxID=3114757 RepID=UPI002E16E4DB|nr:ABC transporter ATP-binding protein [Uliginosibacterium sp. H1]
MLNIEAVQPKTGAMALEASGMCKRFGQLAALDQVSVNIPAGSFHALLGENGAGKSTLVKCLVGFYKQDAGVIQVDGRETEIPSPVIASQLGIGMVYQHFTLVPSMTVAENLVTARGRLPWRIDWKREREELAAFMDTMPFKVALDKTAASLAAGEKQKVEIVKQLYLKRRFLILDEPTSVLTPDEADEVLGLVRQLTRDGTLTAMMITHKFREVTAFADAVTVLRRGRLAGGGMVADLDAERMAAMMVGSDAGASHAVREKRAPRVAVPEAAPRLRIEALEALNDTGLPAVQQLSLSIRPGEILGIAGVSGNGQKELAEVLNGQREREAGSVFIGDAAFTGSRPQRAALKVFSLPEEPLKNGCVGTLSVADNMALRNFDQVPLARGGFVNRRALRAQAAGYVEKFRVKTEGVDAPIASLSGGNVQRAVLARELSRPVDVLIVANPVFGLDFAAVAETHARLLAAREAGAAILLISEDLDELLALADRIAVMSEGRLVYETPAESADVRTLGHYMGGGAH